MSGTGADDGSISHPRRRDRERAWRWATMHARPAMSVWRLEAFKSALARSEAWPGSFPDPDRPARAVAGARLRFVVSVVVTVPAFLAWALSRMSGFGVRGRLPAGARRLAAAHGEWSTRTRHVLSAVANASPPVDAILLLGRFRQSPDAIGAQWRNRVGRSLPPIVVPLGLRALLSSLLTWPGLLALGWRDAGMVPFVLSWRERIAIVFRILHGAATAAWWRQNGLRGGEVVFAITGTGDTTQLERAIQASGGRTLHAVHGQAVGPNFVGTSDIALFRSAYDAVAYDALGCYGKCTVQHSFASSGARRADTGLLLLTNLAHPRNSGYLALGAADELALLHCAGEAARLLGPRAQPLCWKPHPVLDTLPEASAVRRAAAAAGFAELPPTADVAAAARNVRWVIASPSTAALDLLQAGSLPLILDPQGTVAGTATGALPQSVSEPCAVAEMLARLDDDAECARHLADSFRSIGPARPLDLRAPDAAA